VDRATELVRDSTLVETDDLAAADPCAVLASE